jgi:hypothetical protein
MAKPQDRLRALRNERYHLIALRDAELAEIDRRIRALEITLEVYEESPQGKGEVEKWPETST